MARYDRQEDDERKDCGGIRTRVCTQLAVRCIFCTLVPSDHVAYKLLCLVMHPAPVPPGVWRVCLVMVSSGSLGAWCKEAYLL